VSLRVGCLTAHVQEVRIKCEPLKIQYKKCMDKENKKFDHLRKNGGQSSLCEDLIKDYSLKILDIFHTTGRLSNHEPQVGRSNRDHL
jgi:hypothetical protein